MKNSKYLTSYNEKMKAKIVQNNDNKKWLKRLLTIRKENDYILFDK